MKRQIVPDIDQKVREAVTRWGRAKEAEVADRMDGVQPVSPYRERRASGASRGLGGRLRLAGLFAAVLVAVGAAASVFSPDDSGTRLSTEPAATTTSVDVASASVTSSVLGPVAAVKWRMLPYEGQRSSERRGCVTIEVGDSRRSTCISNPGPQFWTVGGVLFVIASHTVVLSDGQEFVPDAEGVAVGVLGGNTVKFPVAPTDACPAREIGSAIANSVETPHTAWMVVRCATNRAASVYFNAPEAGAFNLTYANATWGIVGTVSSPFRCADLAEPARDACLILFPEYNCADLAEPARDACLRFRGNNR